MIQKSTFLLFLAALSVYGQVFPPAVATKTDLLEARDLASSYLSASMGSDDTSFTVAAVSTFTNNMVVLIGSEQIFCTTFTGTTFSGCTRAFGGTSAASHSINASVKGIVTAAHHNSLVDEVIAIETALGANLDHPLRIGTSLPATCAVGNIYYKTDATAGQNIYGCTATNTWTVQTGGSEYQPLDDDLTAVAGGNPDFSGMTTTKPVKAGTTAPATCGVGELFYDTDAVAGENLFGCTATNTWTQMSGSGSGAGMSAQLGDFEVVRTDSNTLTIGGNCSASTPCVVGPIGTRVSASGTVNVTAGTGSVFIDVMKDGSYQLTYTSGLTINTTGCAGTCSTVEGTQHDFEAVQWVGTWQVSVAATFDDVDFATVDSRVFSGRVPWVEAGSHLIQTDNVSTGIRSLSVNTATIPTYSSGTATPSAACSPGELYNETDADKLWACTSTDTWTDLTVGLPSDPTDCVAPKIVTGLAQDGTLTCSYPDVFFLENADDTESTQSTSANNVMETVTVPANTLAAGDGVHCWARYTDNEATTYPNFAFGVSGSNYATSNGAAGDVTTEYDIWFWVTTGGSNGTLTAVKRAYQKTQSGGTPTTYINAASVDFTGIDFTQAFDLTFQGWFQTAPTGTLDLAAHYCEVRKTR